MKPFRWDLLLSVGLTLLVISTLWMDGFFLSLIFQPFILLPAVVAVYSTLVIHSLWRNVFSGPRIVALLLPLAGYAGITLMPPLIESTRAPVVFRGFCDHTTGGQVLVLRNDYSCAYEDDGDGNYHGTWQWKDSLVALSLAGIGEDPILLRMDTVRMEMWPLRSSSLHGHTFGCTERHLRALMATKPMSTSQMIQPAGNASLP